MRFSVFLCVLIISSVVQAQDFKNVSKKLFRNKLQERALTVPNWIKKINEESFDFLCLGETHNDYFRNYYANQILNALEIKKLLIEEQEGKTFQLVQNYVEARPPEESLVTGAPFYPIIDSLFSNWPEVRIYGVEQNKKQRAAVTFAQLDYLNGNEVDWLPSRDGFIAENVDVHLQDGQDRVVALYGSKHCSLMSNTFGFETPFFRFLYDKYKGVKKIKAVKIMAPDRSHFLRLQLEAFGLIGEDGLVLTDLRSLDPTFYNFHSQIFLDAQSYDALIFPPKE